LPSWDSVDLTGDYGNDDEGRILSDSFGSIKAQIVGTWSRTDDLIPGSDDNNLQTRFTGILSPVHSELAAMAVITPLPFLQFQGGISAGTGWSAFGFQGLAIRNDLSGEVKETTLEGSVWSGWLKSQFQFDLGAICPGIWSHVIFVASSKFTWETYTEAEDDEPWLYAADAGMNYNGLSHIGSFLLGYQMPLKLSFSGIKYDISRNMGDIASLDNAEDTSWGSDFTGHSISLLNNIEISFNHSLMVVASFDFKRAYTDETLGAADFRHRDGNGGYWSLDNVALSYNIKL